MKEIRSPIDQYKPSSWIQQLFRLLNSTYDHRWSSLAHNRNGWLYKMREWENDLSDFTGEELNYAFERSKTRKNEKGDLNVFPPTLVEFKSFADVRRKQRLNEEKKKELKPNNMLEFKQRIESEAFKQFRAQCLGYKHNAT